MSRRSPLAALLAVSTYLLASACGGGDTTPVNRVPTVLSVIAGDAQSGPAGTALANPVRVRASDAQGPLPGIGIHALVPAGAVTPQTAVTSADGIGEFTWTLAGTMGIQTLSLSVTNGPATTASATATAGTPSLVVPISLQFQVVGVGRNVPVRPVAQVTDAFGNPLAGVTVTFANASVPAGIITGITQATDAAGNATLGSWALGPDAGTYVVRASIASGAFTTFQVTGVATGLTIVTGNGQNANAGTSVPVLPAVKAVRDDGSALPGVPVAFTAASGGGRVEGGSAVTGGDGIARPSRWILGPAPGANTLSATSLGTSPLLFGATGVAATPASLVAASPQNLSGFVGNFLLSAPSVSVRDASGNPIAGAPITFQTTSGDGTLFGAAAASDFLGRATVGAWRLGSAATTSVQATVGILPPVTFSATGNAVPAGTFRIEVRYRNGTPTASQKSAFDQAVARWTQLIVAGAVPYLVVPTDVDPSGQCPSMNGELVDGIVIYADLKPIDGAGRVLGSTGVCIVRDIGFLPVEGLMTFDTADLPSLESAGQLNLVILHEMAHALGYGTIWQFDVPGLGTNAFLDGQSGPDPTFNGPAARGAFFGAIAAGSTFTGTPVPVEATGGAGTAYSHWRETTFGSELLTGFLNSGSNPLSAISVQQFRDLGYVVNDALADPYSFTASLLGGFQAPPMQIVEGVLPGLITVINRQGGVVARVPRR